MLINYNMPLNFSDLRKKGGKLKKVDLHESVRQNIFMMLISRYGSLRADPEYGWGFWEHDFDHAKVIDKKGLEFEREIRHIILDRERRLSPDELKVNLKITRAGLPGKRGKKIHGLKKIIQVIISGRLLENNEEFTPQPFLLYFSPVAIESDE